MPYNIIFRHTDEMAYRMWTAARRVIPADCSEILAGKESKPGRVFCGGLVAFALRIEHWGGRVNGRLYKVSDDCVHCGKCVRDCPTGNITADGEKFKFGRECIMCMRCSFNCPANAIKIGLFEGWEVNGAYSFERPAVPEEDKHKKYCKKAYQRYFETMRRKSDQYDGGV